MTPEEIRIAAALMFLRTKDPVPFGPDLDAYLRRCAGGAFTAIRPGAAP